MLKDIIKIKFQTCDVDFSIKTEPKEVEKGTLIFEMQYENKQQIVIMGKNKITVKNNYVEKMCFINFFSKL